jgi:hypothetical protein
MSHSGELRDTTLDNKQPYGAKVVNNRTFT